MVQALANGSAGGIFAAAAKQFQAKAQAAFQKMQQAGTGNAASARSAETGGIADFIDPETRKKLEAMKQDADSLVQKLSTGGESAKEAAARKKDEAKQKLKMLKLQAQLAAASGDKKAAARIAKEAAQVAKELGQAVKDRGGGGSGSTPTAGADSGAAGTDTATVAADAQATAQQAAQAATGAQTPPAEAGAEAAPPEAATGTPSAEADATSADADSARDQAAAGTGAEGQDAKQSIQDQRDAIIKEGAERKAEMEFQQDTRRVMDELRSIHRQMKALARKDGSAGTAAEMDRAGSDMADADRMVSDAFGGSTGLTAAPAVASVDIRV